METQYNSFLIRSWALCDGAGRLVVEHVQSGQKVAVPSLAAALGWMTTWSAYPPGDNAPGQPASDGGQTWTGEVPLRD